MLPNPDFNWKKQPEIKVWRKHSKDDETSVALECYETNGCFSLFEEALRKNEVLFFLPSNIRLVSTYLGVQFLDNCIYLEMKPFLFKSVEWFRNHLDKLGVFLTISVTFHVLP